MSGACWSIAPSVRVRIVPRSGSIPAQASSKPRMTACQKGLEAEEWRGNTISLGWPSSRGGAGAAGDAACAATVVVLVPVSFRG